MYRKKITVMIETHISLGFCGYYCFSLPDIIPITIIDNSLLCAFLYFITIIISLLHEPYCNIKYYIHIIYFRPLLVDIRSPTVSRSLARAPKQGFPNPGPNTFFLCILAPVISRTIHISTDYTFYLFIHGILYFNYTIYQI